MPEDDKTIHEGKFRIGEIGRGGMGIVYKGIHTVLGQEVAIKMLHPQLTIESGVEERFLKEARIQARLSHPNIVTIHNFLTSEGRYFIVMEYIRGKEFQFGEKKAVINNLALFLKDKKPLTLDEIKKIFGEVALALKFAHNKNIVHRDIKPGNVLLTEYGMAKLSDFGIAKILGGDKTLSRSGIILGTPHYIAPEQCEGKKIDARTDIYSLGIMLYEMATGKVPFEGDSDFVIMRKHTEEPPVPPREINPEINRELEAVILKAIAKDSKDRFDNVDEFASAVESISARKPKVSIKKKRSPIFNLLWLLPVIAIGAFFLFKERGSPEVEVPNLIGFDTSNARQIAEEKGMIIKIAGELESDSLDPGRIISQDKLSGQKIRKGSSVEVIVSKGKMRICPIEGKTYYTRVCPFCGEVHK